MATATMPQAPAEKPKRVSPPKENYTVPDGGLLEWPSDWESSKHKPLTKKDFADEVVYLLGKADRLELAVKRMRQNASDIKALGGVKERDKAKKLIALSRKFADLKAQLSGDGVNVDAILASLAAG